ncbi:lytic transglycosylase domain-containing protein [Sphingomonas sp. AR_OL41]|uniref:lytic transglycosylase domain-containing protein n=1 Tax=Sphingomonas sp. AR_OL41 TaxID=3042729 RepID=UPI00247FEE0D|nr:lytic transglycosylase domain-containing protein [Sphingomonas sp. AR_OL41]MDH7973288.1 lytic transglycosylase domain-containing protein [Sphingomonas sp. AR_OL41]
MRPLQLAALFGMVLLPQPALARSADGAAPARIAIADFVSEAARRFAIPEAWIDAVMRAESAGNPDAVSPKGATGLMQIMPATWRGLRARYALGSDIRDPHDNIVAGAGYLRELYDRFGSPGFLAAYNAGPARYAAYLAGGATLPCETIVYVRRLAPAMSADDARIARSTTSEPIAWTRSAWTRSALFAGATRTEPASPGIGDPAIAARMRGSPSREMAGSPRGSARLFIPLSGRPR